MGAGFWLIQALFVVAAIATAIFAERDRGGEQPRAWEGPFAGFSPAELTRLMRLRNRVEASRYGDGGLLDDLAPRPPRSRGSRIRTACFRTSR